VLGILPVLLPLVGGVGPDVGPDMGYKKKVTMAPQCVTYTGSRKHAVNESEHVHAYNSQIVAA